MNFYVRRGNQEYGPYTETDLRTYIASGNIQPMELVRPEGSAQFTVVSNVLSPAGATAAPPPPFSPSAGTAPYQPYPPAYVVQPGYQQKERIAYILLGIFLGVFGVHNFYAGYKGRAIAQLLITVLTVFLGSFVSAIWAIIDVCTVTKDASGVPFR